jgi:hypothetical protein
MNESNVTRCVHPGTEEADDGAFSAGVSPVMWISKRADADGIKVPFIAADPLRGAGMSALI